jgi:hypothetical protein
MMGIYVRDIGHPKCLALPKPIPLYPWVLTWWCSFGYGFETTNFVQLVGSKRFRRYETIQCFLCKAQAVVLCSEVAPMALKYALKYVRANISKWLGPKHGSLNVVKHQNYVGFQWWRISTYKTSRENWWNWWSNEWLMATTQFCMWQMISIFVTMKWKALKFNNVILNHFL